MTAISNSAPAIALPAQPRERATLKQLQLITLAWVFGSFWMYTIAGVAFTQFVRSLGTPDSRFGALAALPFIAVFFQLGASYVLERFGGRKQLFIASLCIARLMWLAVAAIPWLLPDVGELYWYALLGCLLVSWIANAVGTPAWMNWMADVIPRRVRGRYMAMRQTVTRPIGLIVGIGVGLLLDVVEKSGDPNAMMRVTSLLIAVAALLGTADIICFLWVRDPAPAAERRCDNWLRQIRESLGDGNFRRFLAYHGTLVLATAFIGPFCWLFVLDVAQVTNWQASVMLMALPLLITVFSYGFWGRMIDSVGKKRVLVMAGAIFVFGPCGWLIVGPGDWLLGYLLTCISPFAFPGIELATFNILLDVAGGKDERGRRGSTVYTAVHSAVLAVAGMASGLLVWWFTSSFDGYDPQYAVGEIPWTYHKTLFVASSLLRVLAIVIALGIIDRRRFAARTLLQHTASCFYANLKQVGAAPGKAIGQLRRWAFRVNG